MSTWPKFRESIIRAWHGVLDYDRKIPKRVRAATAEKREEARSRRISVDDEREARRIIRNHGIIAERRSQSSSVVPVEVVRENPLIHAEMKLRDEQDRHFHQPGQCPNCGSGMGKTRKSVGSGAGCLIFILGLFACSTIVGAIIGIPIIIIGIFFLGKTEGQWTCRRCRFVFPRAKDLGDYIGTLIAVGVVALWGLSKIWRPY